MTLAPDVDVFDYARSVMCQLMRERGTTQVQLVPVLGIVQVGVSDRVRGRTKLSLADIHRLASFWGVDPREFFPPVPTADPDLLTCTKYQLPLVGAKDQVNYGRAANPGLFAAPAAA